MGWSRWKCQAGPRQESQGKKDALPGLHLAGGSTGAGEVQSTLHVPGGTRAHSGTLEMQSSSGHL